MNRKRLGALLLTFMLTLGLVAVPQAGSAANENLALGATAITKSDFNSGYGKEKLNDGITSGANNMRWTTDWSVAANNIGQWCGVEFDVPTKIDKIVFYEYDSRITEYKVEYMDAEGNWNVVQKDGAALANQTKEAKETVNSAHSVANTVTFDAVEAKAVRLYIVNVGEKAGASIWEFEVYCVSIITADTNLAVAKGTGISDPEKSTTEARFSAAKLNDGGTSGESRWSSNWGLEIGAVAGVWAGIRFEERTAFDKVTIKEFQGRVTKFIIEVSDDGQNWKAVKQDGQELPVQEKEYQQSCPSSMRTYDISFDRVKAAYVRYRIVEVGEKGPSIWEFEVYDSLAGAPFEEVEDEAEFQADVNSVTEVSLLGDNPDAQHITEDLTLTASPLPNWTRLTWSVVSGGEWIDNKGKVTRPAADSADQEVQLKATFASPGGTYTAEKTFTFTVLKLDAALIEEQFRQDLAIVTEAYLLGANADAAHVKWDLNLPISPLPNGTTVAWSVKSGTAIAADGTVTRPSAAQQVTLQAAFTKFGASTAAETRDFTFTVLPEETAEWKLVENVKVEDPRGASTYAITQITEGVSSATAQGGGVRFGQLANSQVPDNNRPDMRLNFADKIKSGKKYYVEMTVQADMKAGETRVVVLNSTNGEGALFIFNKSNTLNLAANNGSGRNWVQSEVPISHTHGSEETIGIYYDTVQNTFQFVSGRTIAAEKAYKPSYGTGISGVQVSYQGNEGDENAYIIVKGLKVYEYEEQVVSDLTEAEFQAEVAGVTEQSLLGTNTDAQNVVSDLTLIASPLPKGTKVVWSVVSGGEWINNQGKVTRPAADGADQTVQLKAVFTSPGDTYTTEKTFTFTVKKESGNPAEEWFQQDIASVTEAYLLGANPDAEHVQWSLNLPVSPLQGGTTVAWSVKSGTAIAANGKVTRPETEAQQVTLQAAFTKAGAAAATETRDFTFTVLPDEKAIWKLVENVKVEDPRGASTYAITQITDGVSSSTAQGGGVRFGQLTNNEVPSNNRPDMRLNFVDKIKPGKKYYVEMTLQADMKKGEARVIVLNSTNGEGALFIFRSSNTLGLAANNGSGRNWIDSEVKINHTHGKEETIGIYYDTATGAFQHVSGGKLASQKTYKPSYGSGIGGVQVSYQGKEGDKDAYIVTKGMKVYEYDADYAAQIEAEFSALSAADLTQQVPEMITGNLTLPSALPCGVPIHWESDMPDVIGTDGTITRPEDAEKTVRLTAKIDETGLSLSKTFDFTVLWTGDARIGFTEDVALVTYEALTAQEPDKLTESLNLPSSPLPNGTTVTWTTSDAAVLSAGGVVTRPAGRNHPVTLTAKFQNGELSAEKTFRFTVLAEGDLLENMAADARPSANVAALEGSIVAVTDKNYETAWTVAAKNAAVTLDLGSEKLLTHAVLYAEGNIGNAVLEVSNDNVNYTKATQWNTLAFGQEIRFPLTGARYVRLSMTQQDEMPVKIYEIELYSMPTDEERVQADVKAFTYTNPKIVTTDIVLPTATKFGSTIEWSSDNAAALDAQGHVTRQSDDQNVTLTATFRSGDKSETVTVYHTVKGTKPAAGQSPGGGGGGGGSVSGGSGGAGMQVPVIQPENTVRPQPQPQETRFYDVEMQRWSYPYIERLAQQGIVNGSGGAFDPEGHLTREQLVKLLVTALKLDTSTQNTDFADVAAGEWYSPYIAAAAQAGIVSGISETEFGVGEYVSREDMATMICRALEKSGAQILNGTADVTFADSAQISAYAQEAVMQLAALGILNGENGNFLPADTATREQGAKVICMVLDKIGR